LALRFELALSESAELMSVERRSMAKTTTGNWCVCL
jgi:hypothetical protein